MPSDARGAQRRMAGKPHLVARGDPAHVFRHPQRIATKRCLGKHIDNAKPVPCHRPGRRGEAANASVRRGGAPLSRVAGRGARQAAPHADERRQVGLAVAAFFMLLCGYYILRPVRDEMGVQTGAAQLHWLFTATFVATLLVTPVYGWLVARVRPGVLVPAVFGLVIACVLGFGAIFKLGVSAASAAAFFVWLSVVNLFLVALFWSRLGDLFTPEQARRLYGYVAAGGTAGALVGPAATALLARQLGAAHLLTVSATLFAAATGCLVALGRRAPDRAQRSSRPIGGSMLAGITLTFQHPSLRGLALLTVCYSTVATILYVEQASLVARAFADAGERTAFFATIDLAVNIVALGVQVLGTRALVQRLGLRVALSAAPVLTLCGLGVLAVWPTAACLAAVQVLHRSGEYALMRPGREMIYTALDPESRHKAKSFIDTAVYRANDAANSWLASAVRAAGLNAVLVVALPAATAWLATGFLVGRRHDGASDGQ